MSLTSIRNWQNTSDIGQAIGFSEQKLLSISKNYGVKLCSVNNTYMVDSEGLDSAIEKYLNNQVDKQRVSSALSKMTLGKSGSMARVLQAIGTLHFNEYSEITELKDDNLLLNKNDWTQHIRRFTDKHVEIVRYLKNNKLVEEEQKNGEYKRTQKTVEEEQQDSAE